MKPETSKRRRSRIELGYYKSGDGYSRFRSALCGLAIAGVAAWTGYACLAGGDRSSGILREPSLLASKGTLAKPHAMWDSQCSACHRPFSPISTSLGSERCKSCHAGPAHHANERKADTPACAECHKDHQGRDASLTAMQDVMCTRCHAQLDQHAETAGQALAIAPAVTRFDLAHHPEFPTLAEETRPAAGRVKFNHRRHLAAGMPAEQGGAVLTYGDLPESVRSRYGFTPGEKLDAPVHLACASCHQLDPAPPAQRGHGDYMAPIAYESHCSACHPLALTEQKAIRHGLPAAEVLADVREYYSAQAALADPDLLRKPLPPARIPSQPGLQDSEAYSAAIDARVLSSARRLFGAGESPDLRSDAGRGGCVECHRLKPGSGEIVSIGSLAGIAVEPVAMRPIWFAKARFAHSAHRAIECSDCHAAAWESRSSGDLNLLPGIATCASCHAPAATFSRKGKAGALCVECHRYHDGDHPLAGEGAPARDAIRRFSVQSFAEGGAPAK